MSTIEFNTTLSDGDWEQRQGGWRCEALLIPGTQLKAIYHDGDKADTKNYSIERNIIRWANVAKPKEIVVVISLTGDLPQLENDKLLLEKEKLNLEREKTRIENRWKVITALGAILSTLITLGTTYILGNGKLASSVQNQNLLEGRLGKNVIEQLQILPLDGIEFLLHRSQSMYISVQSDNSDEYLLPNNYDTMKRLEELGFIAFTVPAAEFEAILEKLEPAGYSSFAGYKVYIGVNSLSPDQRSILQKQAYALTDKGKLVVSNSISMFSDQVNQSNN